MQFLKGIINSLANPRLFFLMSVAGFTAASLQRLG